jgi:hypothetical protein
MNKKYFVLSLLFVAHCTSSHAIVPEVAVPAATLAKTSIMMTTLKFTTGASVGLLAGYASYTFYKNDYNIEKTTKAFKTDAAKLNNSSKECLENTKNKFNAWKNDATIKATEYKDAAYVRATSTQEAMNDCKNKASEKFDRFMNTKNKPKATNDKEDSEIQGGGDNNRRD